VNFRFRRLFPSSGVGRFHVDVVVIVVGIVDADKQFG
jgi:hypothetical protein